MVARDAEVAVVGGGMAGLAAAWRLGRRGRDVVVLEGADRVGGVVATTRTPEGFSFEDGPNSLRAGATHVLALIRALGLEGDLIAAGPAAKTRYIWRHGALHPVPASPPALLTSELLSWRGKLRLLTEPLRGTGRGDPGDETIADICRRRLGDEAVRALVDPVVTGIFAGDAERLGADALPFVRDAERAHGGFLRAMLARRGGGGAGIFTLRGGLGQLPARLAAELGDRVRLSAHASAVEADADGVVVHLAGGGRVRAQHAILATPGHVVPTLLPDVAATAFLAAQPSPFVATVGLGYRRGDVAHDLAGFGALRASDSPLPVGIDPIMGVVFAGSVFEGRAPEGHHALTVLIGGAHDPGAAAFDDDALAARAIAAVRALFGASEAPVAQIVRRWPRAIPQYRPGHAAAVARLRAAAPPRVGFAGNWLRGVALDDAIASGFGAADALG